MGAEAIVAILAGAVVASGPFVVEFLRARRQARGDRSPGLRSTSKDELVLLPGATIGGLGIYGLIYSITSIVRDGPEIPANFDLLYLVGCLMSCGFLVFAYFSSWRRTIEIGRILANRHRG